VDAVRYTLACVGFAAACGSAFAQVPRLAPSAPPVEVIDPSERISGNAATGIVLGQPTDRIGVDRLWAYLSEPIAPELRLNIASVDGRYYAEIAYATSGQKPGWVALDLRLREFSFLEKNYANPLREIAAVLSDAATPRYYPVRWGEPHTAAAKPPPAPKDDDVLFVYMNTERANAFVLVDNAPRYCGEASAVSAFKFNAICDVTLGALRREEAGAKVVTGLEVYRRAGVRTLAPVTIDVPIRY
jgi:hypothetical protein